jgi:hypothetical protein
LQVYWRERPGGRTSLVAIACRCIGGAAARRHFHQWLAGQVVIWGLVSGVGSAYQRSIGRNDLMRLMDRRIGITLEYSFSNISIARNRLLLGFMRANDQKELFVYAARVDLRFSQSVLARAS